MKPFSLTTNDLHDMHRLFGRRFPGVCLSCNPSEDVWYTERKGQHPEEAKKYLEKVPLVVQLLIREFLRYYPKGGRLHVYLGGLYKIDYRKRPRLISPFSWTLDSHRSDG
jgi:hypothetical protein